MKKILLIKSSPRGEQSFSNQLSNELISKLETFHKKVQTTNLDFATSPPPHLSGMQLGTMFTPEEHQTDEQRSSMVQSNQYVSQIIDNDIIVITYPVWNFLVPSSIKAWIDQIVRVGVTFKYNGHLPEGLVTGKKVYLVLARGGMYSDEYDNSPSSLFDFSIHYMKTVLGYLGMKDVTIIKADGLAIPDVKDRAMEGALASINIE